MPAPRADLLLAGPMRGEDWPRLVAAVWPWRPARGPVCLLAELTGPAVLVGRYGVLRAERHAQAGRRATGGRPLRIQHGTWALAVAAPRTGALLLDGRDVPPAKIVNRFVRPSLGALAALGVSAGYFGRDFISVASQPAAAVSFDAGRDGSALCEVLFAFEEPFGEGWDRIGFAPTPDKMVAALRRGFQERLGVELGDPQPAPQQEDPPWPPAAEELPPRASSQHAVPIGHVEARVEVDDLASRRAGAPVLARARVLGDFQADAPSVAALEASLRGCPATFEQVGQRVDAQFGPRGPGTLVGLKSLKPIADAIVEAAIDSAPAQG